MKNYGLDKMDEDWSLDRNCLDGSKNITLKAYLDALFRCEKAFLI